MESNVCSHRLFSAIISRSSVTRSVSACHFCHGLKNTGFKEIRQHGLTRYVCLQGRLRKRRSTDTQMRCRDVVTASTRRADALSDSHLIKDLDNTKIRGLNDEKTIQYNLLLSKLKRYFNYAVACLEIGRAVAEFRRLFSCSGLLASRANHYRFRAVT